VALSGYDTIKKTAAHFRLDFVALVSREERPTLVLHCAAERRPDVVAHNADATQKLNVQATGMFAAEAAKVLLFIWHCFQPEQRKDFAPNFLIRVDWRWLRVHLD
jgi:dTDP-4-dehydrorhamnose reductase